MYVDRIPVEKEQIIDMLSKDMTFYNVFRKDWTKNVLDDLNYRLYGKIPRNFLINISGHIGTPSGIFKSSMGLQIALKLDPFFTLTERVGFSVNQLIDKIENYSEYHLCNRCFILFTQQYKGTYEYYEEENKNKECDNCNSMSQTMILLTKLLFFLDEQTKTLKTGGMTRLANIVDTCRQRQICFITCGIEQYGFNFMTYSLKRIQESSDDFLPEKTVQYAVYDENRDIYYGYFKWDITPLTNPVWKSIWAEYSKMKTDFQRTAIQQQIQGMDFEDLAEEIMNQEDFQKCVGYRKDGKRFLQSNLVKNIIIKRFPDLTGEERSHILSEIKLILYEE